MPAKEHKVGFEQRVADPEIFDFVFFDRMTMGEQVLQREVIELFRQQLTLAVNGFGHLSDDAGWRHLTHTIRGAAAAVGAVQIARRAQTWEAMRELPDEPALAGYKAELQILADAFLSEARCIS